MVHALVTGATGYIGSRLVAELARQDVWVTATARDVGKFDDFDFPAEVGRVELDVADADSCRQAFGRAGASERGPVSVAYFLVHSIGEGDFAEQDLDSARTFAAAARDAGVTRIVYLGGFVPDDEQLSEHLESRADVGDALADAGVELVWLRAAVILGAGSTSFELIRHLADRLKIVPMPKWMNNPVSPVAVADVLRYLVQAAEPEALPADAYDISNGDRPTYAQLIKQYAAVRGLRRWWIPLPPVPAGLVARIVSWLTPLPRELAADLVRSLPNTMDSHDDRIRTFVPDPPDGLVTTRDALARAVAPRTVRGVFGATDPMTLADTDPDWAG